MFVNEFIDVNGLIMDNSRRCESLSSPHLFLNRVLITFSLENDRLTDAVDTASVAFILRSFVCF